MDFLRLQLLALLQGVAEFLPVSSSGHLALLKNALDLRGAEEGPLLEVLLHGGTLLAVLLFYRKRVAELLAGLLHRDHNAWIYAGKLLLACIPAGVLYFAAHDRLESAFESPRMIGGCLIGTGVFLLTLRYAEKRPEKVDLPPQTQPKCWQALLIGLAQAVAILPGISRSGSTYTAARWLNVPAKEAFDFSFLTSIPLIGGAILLKLRHFGELWTPIDGAPTFGLSALLTATALAAVVGYAALALLKNWCAKGRLWIFGAYCLIAGFLALALA